MPDVLALLDRSAHAALVADAASALAARRGSRVRALHVREDDADVPRTDLALTVVHGDAVEQILSRISRDDVDLAVIGARDDPADRRAAGHVALAVLEQVGKPCLVVPPRTALAAPDGPGLALLHVDVEPPAVDALRSVVDLLADAGYRLSGVHVFEPRTVPRFWDQVEHAGQSWAAALVDRIGSSAEVTLALRTGTTAESLLTAADEEGVDLIAVCWARRGDPARGTVLRELVRHAHVPVLLMPLPEDGGPSA